MSAIIYFSIVIVALIFSIGVYFVLYKWVGYKKFPQFNLFF